MADRAQPFFLDGPRGPLFCIYFPPINARSSQTTLLGVPPLFEEKNRSRHVQSLMARRFQEGGRAVLLVDLYGTGDSTGEHCEADWMTWQADLDAAAEWLKSHGHAQLGLWGLRAGALLAMDFIRRHVQPIDLLLLWQPVVQGETWIRQLLRMRVAQNIAEGKESTEELYKRLMEGETLEIAGYDISSALARNLAEQLLPDELPEQIQRTVWLEVGHKQGKNLAYASRKKVDMWQTKGREVLKAVVQGVPFWVSEVNQELPQLLAKTLSLTERSM